MDLETAITEVVDVERDAGFDARDEDIIRTIHNHFPDAELAKLPNNYTYQAYLRVVTADDKDINDFFGYCDDGED